MYPVDLLKVSRLIAFYDLQPDTNPFQTRMQIVNASSSIVYNGLSNAVLTISRAEGVRSLWRGLSSVVAGAGVFIFFISARSYEYFRLTTEQGPAHAVYFATYESVKHTLGGNNGKNEHHPFAAGWWLYPHQQHLLSVFSCERSQRYNRQRCTDESF